MSRYIEEKDGKTITTIEDMDKCKWLYNEICCHDKSEFLANYPYPSTMCENKKICKYFEKEDGKV